MSNILTQLKYVCQDLNELRAKWALIGALAVGVYGEPRTTKDIDIAVVVANKAEQEALVNEFVKRGYGPPQLLWHAMPAHKLGNRLQVRGNVPNPTVVDLLFSSSGIENEVVTRAQKLEVFPGLEIPVASRGHLIAMKVLSKDDFDRIRDNSDLQQLVNGASEIDLDEARAALDLMCSSYYLI